MLKFLVVLRLFAHPLQTDGMSLVHFYEHTFQGCVANWGSHVLRAKWRDCVIRLRAINQLEYAGI